MMMMVLDLGLSMILWF